MKEETANIIYLMHAELFQMQLEMPVDALIHKSGIWLILKRRSGVFIKYGRPGEQTNNIIFYFAMQNCN